jgi:hypothetical protein
MVMASPAISKKFRMLPTPKKRRTKNRDRDRAERRPLRVLAKRVEKVKRRLRKRKVKKRGRAIKVSGSIK